MGDRQNCMNGFGQEILHFQTLKVKVSNNEQISGCGKADIAKLKCAFRLIVKGKILQKKMF